MERLTYTPDCKRGEIIPGVKIDYLTTEDGNQTFDSETMDNIVRALVRLAEYENHKLNPHNYRKAYAKTCIARKIVPNADGDVLRCPECGEDLMGGINDSKWEDIYIQIEDEEINNCWHCGQKIDWNCHE
jgi:predicted RNA-binding Zn-ribbon protein involved in translation (DUF1610 family)